MHLPRMLLSRSSIRSLIAVALVCCTAAVLSAQDKQKQPAAQPAKSATTAAIDPSLIGVWGVDTQGGYDFRADGTFILQGSVTYRFDASKGIWHYWQPATPSFKIAAEYKISADGKSLSINLKTGKPCTNLKKIG